MKNILFIIVFVVAYNSNFAQCNENFHSNNVSDNWQSCAMKSSPNAERENSHWVQYDLGYIYPITSSYIWNYNVSGATDKGFKEIVIDYSIDGTVWTQLGTYTFAQASGSNVYAGFTGPDFGDVSARYILITASSNYGNACYGLAECKFNLGEDVIIGITEIENENRLSVSPNPAHSIIQISSQNLEIDELIIRNATGFEIQRYDENFPENMDISYLANGVYFIIVNTKDNNFIVKKFVKVGK